jgi:hypothetical protein
MSGYLDGLARLKIFAQISDSQEEQARGPPGPAEPRLKPLGHLSASGSRLLCDRRAGNRNVIRKDDM